MGRVDASSGVGTGVICARVIFSAVEKGMSTPTGRAIAWNAEVYCASRIVIAGNVGVGASSCRGT